jgi:hypothetical protein
MNQTTMQKPLAAALLAACAGTSAHATLVAYFPLDEGAAGTTASVIDDVIDDPAHGVTDGTANNANATWVNDPTRGIVLSTVQGNRFTAGTQDIDLSLGFTWSLWVKMSSAGNADSGADVIIGSRNGVWNKVQPAGTQRYFDLGNYDVNDDAWHHLAYTGDASGAAFYVDGVVVDTDNAPFNGIQTVNDVMEIGGSSRFSEDSEGLLSDIAIWNERLTDQRIAELAAGGGVIPKPTLTLQVDRGTGQAAILGIPGDTWDINYYQLTSAADSLNPAGWDSLADQDIEGSGPPNGTGDGWEEAGGSDAGVLGEGYLTGNTTVPADGQIALGAAYDTSVDARDLVFTYSNELGLIYEGDVVYVNTAIPGDTDGDGDVDDADLGVAFSNYTGPLGPGAGNKTAAQGDTDGDGDVDDADLGAAFAAYTGPIASATVPEPTSLALLGLAGLLATRRRPTRD